MIVRIELSERNSEITKIYDNYNEEGEGSDGTENEEKDDRDDIRSFFEDRISFSLEPTTLQGYEYSRYSHPTVAINVTVPEGDRQLAASWLGSSSSSSVLPSDTVIRRMTTSVMGSLVNYYGATISRSLFTRPFRIG